MRQTGALGGLLVADFSRILAGPLTTMVLADLGAEVVKVERPGTGDDTRRWGPPFDATGRSTYFSAVNRNKTSLVVDLGSPDGLAAARELIGRAGIVVENFRPGVMDGLGLGYEELSREIPGLIYCSISAFGRGAGAKLPGYDLIVQAGGGLMSITGEPDGAPQKVGVALVDVVSGLYAAIGILAALRHRDISGEGQRVEVTLLGALLAAMSNQSSAWTAGGVIATRMGNDHPSIAPYELLATNDGTLAVAVGNDRQFAALCEVLNLTDLPTLGAFATNVERVRNRPELRERLERRLSAAPTAEWVAKLTAARVPAGPVNDIAGAFELATTLGLEPTVTMQRPDGTSVTLPASPLTMTGTPVSYRLAPPDLPA